MTGWTLADLVAEPAILGGTPASGGGREHRSELETQAAGLAGHETLRLTKSSLASLLGCPDFHEGDRSAEGDRALLVGRLLDLLAEATIAGADPSRATPEEMDDLVGATLDGDLHQRWAALDAGGRAEVAATAGERAAAIGSLIGPDAGDLRWRVQSSAATSLGPGRVICTGRFDAEVLTPAGWAVVEWKSGSSAGGAAHSADAGFYALLATWRDDRPPPWVATAYAADRTLMAVPVTDGLLDSAAHRISAALARSEEIAAGRPPPLQPGPRCSWCARATSCPAAFPTDAGGEM